MKKILHFIFGISLSRVRKIICGILLAIFLPLGILTFVLPIPNSQQFLWPFVIINLIWLYSLITLILNSRIKWVKWLGVALSVIIVTFLLLVAVVAVMKYVAKIGRLPQGTKLVLIDTNDKPSQSNFSNKTPPDFGWPVSQAYQKYAENFHWWLIDFHQSGRIGKAIKEDKPTLAVAFNLPVEEIPVLASFSGTVRITLITQSGDGPKRAEIELSNGEYMARYEDILGPTVKEGAMVQKGDAIGTIALAPRAVFPKENLGQWKKRDAIGNFNFQFSLFKIGEGDDKEPVWITTESFTQ